MEFRLINENADWTAVWVNWSAALPYWERNTFHPLNRDELVEAFHRRWFEGLDSKIPGFKIGSILYWERDGSIGFNNGRHRTLLLSKFLDLIPLAIDSSITDYGIYGKIVVREIGKNDLIKLPNFPILEAHEIRHEDPTNKGWL